jgi:hypothetical protein
VQPPPDAERGTGRRKGKTLNMAKIYKIEKEKRM